MEASIKHNIYEEYNNIFYKKLKLNISKKQSLNVNDILVRPALNSYANPLRSLTDMNSEKYVPSVISSPDLIVMSRNENAHLLNPIANESAYSNPFLLHQIKAIQNSEDISKYAQNKYLKEFYDIPGFNNGFADINEYSSVYNRRSYGKSHNPNNFKSFQDLNKIIQYF